MPQKKFFVLLFFSVTVTFIFYPSCSHALGPPARIYGNIVVNNTVLTQDNDDGYSIVITQSDGSHYSPVIMDNDGLTETFYIIDLDVESPDKPDAGDTAVIHVYRKGEELTVISPLNGEFTVGAMGDLTQIDIKVNATLSGFRQSFVGGQTGSKEQKLKMGGGNSLSKDVEIRY